MGRINLKVATKHVKLRVAVRKKPLYRFLLGTVAGFTNHFSHVIEQANATFVAFWS